MQGSVKYILNSKEIAVIPYTLTGDLIVKAMLGVAHNLQGNAQDPHMDSTAVQVLAESQR
jgi:hypothetical protein